MNKDLIFLVIIAILCLIILFLIFRRKPKYDGVFLIDTSDPEKDIFRLELNTLDGLDKKKSVMLKVEAKNEK